MRYSLTAIFCAFISSRQSRHGVGYALHNGARKVAFRVVHAGADKACAQLVVVIRSHLAEKVGMEIELFAAGRNCLGGAV